MKTFIDTNIIIYAHDRFDPVKQGLALDIITSLIREGSGVISTQVFSEFSHVALNKLGMPEAAVRHQLALLNSLEVVTVLPETVFRALELKQLYGVSFWDSQILASAEIAGCHELISEDLNPGQLYSGCLCRNPFLPKNQ